MDDQNNETARVISDLAFAKRHRILAQAEGEVCAVYYCEKPKVQILLELQRKSQTPLQLINITQEEFEQKLSHHFTTGAVTASSLATGINEEMDLSAMVDELPQSEDIVDSEYEAPIIRMLNALLTQAIKQSASDIHFECFENHISVRIRIDGVLSEAVRLDRRLAPLLISRIKVMAKLDIAERRIPQDGRITLQIASHPVDIRVSTIPAVFGERVVLRLLDKNNARLDITHLGLDTDCETHLVELLNRPNGIILVTGPTGSGKTTTLYAALAHLNDVSRNILTVEDPIEYNLEGVGQTQVNTKVDMTFAKGLRAILRQDPDIIMVGEIRDLETAEIAVQASLTGHLVLSTLHTNSALGAVTRLQDMGVEPFLLSSSLIGLMAQRLVRVLCDECKIAYPITEQEAELLRCNDQQATLYKPGKCDACQGLGYRGRCGIYELAVVDDQSRELIHSCVTEQELERYVRQSHHSIYMDGVRKVLQGITSVEELLRVTSNK